MWWENTSQNEMSATEYAQNNPICMKRVKTVAH
jgi:hypothetical protein